MKITVFLKIAVKAVLPYGIMVLHRRNKVKKLTKRNTENYCPICKNMSNFEPFGNPTRLKARCPHCGAFERHRLLWLFWEKKTTLFDNTQKKILHIAAEPCFVRRLKDVFNDNYPNYLTADLYNPSAMVKMDITNIHYSDESFDVIICNHVLEHVSDDLKAMKELYRILNKNGWAILLVPTDNIEKTYEDFSITTESGRLKAFGQHDHVRKYGRDYIDRLKFSGFNVTVFKKDEFASIDEIKRMCLNDGNSLWWQPTEIFYCTK